ncbi:uncharacterized protein LOC123315985 [Coccinella septempunctata]|uniref:uncharacterized protein LOC123315985 n=1 Tax=Coccinella septempunctata TaxID=41139 RepID=UPI001D068550|nr:uncharacterized protein LOC123315985 [Coccinella septempunctata]
MNCDILDDSFSLVDADSHHPPIHFSVGDLDVRRRNHRINCDELNEFNFRKADFVAMYGMILGAQWSDLLLTDEPEKACEILYAILYDIFDKTVPRKSRRRRNFPVWYDAEVVDLVFKKERVWKKYKRTKNISLLFEYKQLRKLLKSKISIAHANYVQSSEQNIILDPAQFWAFVNNRRGSSRIPDEIRDAQGNIKCGQRDVADSFATYFEGIYQVPQCVRTDDGDVGVDSDIVHVSSVCVDDLILAARKLKNKNTAGPDGIPSKLFEIILYKNIFPSIKNRIRSEQHGFMPQRSSLTNLAVFSQELIETLDQSEQLDVIYTDFSKAFDRVDHGRLIMKLKFRFGFSDGLIKLMSSYLSNRLQYVRVENSNSFLFPASSGVPQGSNLGPLLFILFINDLLDGMEVLGLLFADDLKFFLKVKSLLDCVELQHAIDRLYHWCVLNCLSLNVEKCHVISYTRKKFSIRYPYNLNGNDLNRVTQTRDLGVLFDDKCSFVPHIENTISSAFRTYGFIVRNSKYFLNTRTLISLFNSLIRSKLEYASIIWRPIYECHVNRLEAVQRRFYKFLVWRLDSVYPPVGCDHKSLLKRFSAQPLETRRALLALNTLFKLLNNRIDCPALLEKLPILTPRLESRGRTLFYLRSGRTNLSLQSPSHYMCDIYNQIADKVDLFVDSLDKIQKAYIVVVE